MGRGFSFCIGVFKMGAKKSNTSIFWNIYRNIFYNVSLKYKFVIGFFVFAVAQFIAFEIASILNLSGLLLFIFAVVIIALDIYFAFIFAQNLTIPIEQLKDNLEKVKQGDYSRNIEVDALQDEIGELVDSVTEMQGAITSTLSETENLVT